MYRRWIVPVAGLALLAGSFAVAGPAAANTAAGRAPEKAAPGTFRPGGLFRPAPGARPSTAHGHAIVYSSNWSGYAVTGSTFKTVSASWTQPAITCTSGDGQTDMSPWVGIDGYSSSTVEQTGSSGDCNGATPDYYAWYEMYPRNVIVIKHTVKPGDKFTATVAHTSGTKYKLTLKDVTEGWTNTVTKSITAKDDSAEAVMEMAASHLTQFGTDAFTDVMVDGKPIGSYTSSPYKIEQMEIRVSGTVCDTTASLSAEKSFKVTWQNAC
jgi:Peptidase A4 family